VILAGTAGIALTALVLPGTKSARHIVTEKQVHDFRESLAGTGAESSATEASRATSEPAAAVQSGPRQVSPDASKSVSMPRDSSSPPAGPVQGGQ
jgi:hypothetical protein